MASPRAPAPGEAIPPLPQAPLILWRADGTCAPAARCFVPEVPVALEYNGLAYAVMMASPNDLADFATGFALTEGLAAKVADIGPVALAETNKGWIARTQITSLDMARMAERVRSRVAESSCGLCGIENLEAIARPLPQVAPHEPLAPAAILAALAALSDAQPLGAATRAAHAAALADASGALLAVREDVGRHNAIDKLVGAAARTGMALAEGFILSTARCSYEIVEKAVRAGATSLVTISLPTAMAAARAHAAGLSLWVLARDDAVLQVLPAAP